MDNSTESIMREICNLSLIDFARFSRAFLEYAWKYHPVDIASFLNDIK